jgi:hypothetical protein
MARGIRIEICLASLLIGKEIYEEKFVEIDFGHINIAPNNIRAEL